MLEVYIMKEKIYSVCEKIFQDENEKNKFLSFEKLDDMYDYFSKEIPDLSVEDFDEFISEVLENYFNDKTYVAKLDDNDLENLSGGLSAKARIPAALMSLALLLPSASATSKTAYGISNNFQSMSEVLSKESEVPSAYQRTKAWVKSHRKLLAGAAIVTVLAGGLLLWYAKNSDKFNDKGRAQQQNTGTIERAEAINADMSKVLDSAEGKNHNIYVIKTGYGTSYSAGITDKGLLSRYNDGKNTAIVDASNWSGIGGGGIDYAIFHAMGEDNAKKYIKENCGTYSGESSGGYGDGKVRIHTGGAIIHSSFNIAKEYKNIPYVIQAVAPKGPGGLKTLEDYNGYFSQIYSAYYNAVKLGVRNGCQRLLVPALGMAIFFSDVQNSDDWQTRRRDVAKKCAAVAINAINDARSDMGADDVEIIFPDHRTKNANYRSWFYRGLVDDLGIREIE